MSIAAWIRTPRIRRNLALSTIVLCAGGLVLYRAPANAGSKPSVPISAPAVNPIVMSGKNSTSFSAQGLHGSLALSHTKIPSADAATVFAELVMAADKPSGVAEERAPLSLAVVVDTSGSMSGEKIEKAKESILSLLESMRDDDEIALIRYSSNHEVIQPLTRVKSIRSSLSAKIRALSSDGGTNIPPALNEGLRALSDASKGRVRRVVLVSDGLDNTRLEAERIAKDGAERGVTISSLGIGVDFDEAYMGAIAKTGRGNFAYVKDASALAAFLKKELHETAQTTIEQAALRLDLPAGLRFVRAVGADAKLLNDDTQLELSLGALFAGDERRVIVELSSRAGGADSLKLSSQVRFTRVGGQEEKAELSALTLLPTSDQQAVLEGRDGDVFASAMSALASLRQLEAAQAYSRGDGARAQQLIDQNIADLNTAKAIAPAPKAAMLERQVQEYNEDKGQFVQAAPTTEAGKHAAKASAAKAFANEARPAY